MVPTVWKAVLNQLFLLFSLLFFFFNSMKHSIQREGNTGSEGKCRYLLKKHSWKEVNILLYGWCFGVAALNIPSHCTGASGSLDTCLLLTVVSI